jgi:hypothetical protein
VKHAIRRSLLSMHERKAPLLMNYLLAAYCEPTDRLAIECLA